MSRWITKAWGRWRRFVPPTPAAIPGCVQGAPEIPGRFGFARSVLLLGGLTLASSALAALWGTHPVEVVVGVLAAVALGAATDLSAAAYRLLTAAWRAKRGERRGTY